MKLLHTMILIAFGALLIYASSGLPSQGDIIAPLNQEYSITNTPVASSYYIKNAYSDTKTPNIVTAVLGDYRSFDTFGEQVVIFAAGIIAFLLLGRANKDA